MAYRVITAADMGLSESDQHTIREAGKQIEAAEQRLVEVLLKHLTPNDDHVYVKLELIHHAVDPRPSVVVEGGVTPHTIDTIWSGGKLVGIYADPPGACVPL